MSNLDLSFILCDWAEAINGKLYMMGAGWSNTKANVPMRAAVAILWKIPWTQANQQQKIEIVLLTEDGEPVADPEGKPVRVEGNVEVGRPPGLKQGTPLDAVLAVNFSGLVVSPGGYRFELSVNGSVETTASFFAL